MEGATAANSSRRLLLSAAAADLCNTLHYLHTGQGWGHPAIAQWCPGHAGNLHHLLQQLWGLGPDVPQVTLASQRYTAVHSSTQRYTAITYRNSQVMQELTPDLHARHNRLLHTAPF